MFDRFNWRRETEANTTERQRWRRTKRTKPRGSPSSLTELTQLTQPCCLLVLQLTGYLTRSASEQQQQQPPPTPSSSISHDACVYVPSSCARLKRSTYSRQIGYFRLTRSREKRRRVSNTQSVYARVSEIEIEIELHTRQPKQKQREGLKKSINNRQSLCGNSILDTRSLVISRSGALNTFDSITAAAVAANVWRVRYQIQRSKRLKRRVESTPSTRDD